MKIKNDNIKLKTLEQKIDFVESKLKTFDTNQLLDMRFEKDKMLISIQTYINVINSELNQRQNTIVHKFDYENPKSLESMQKSINRCSYQELKQFREDVSAHIIWSRKKLLLIDEGIKKRHNE